jgi:hypothetical protein
MILEMWVIKDRGQDLNEEGGMDVWRCHLVYSSIACSLRMGE